MSEDENSNNQLTPTSNKTTVTRKHRSFINRKSLNKKKNPISGAFSSVFFNITAEKLTPSNKDYQLVDLIGNDSHDRPTVYSAKHIPSGTNIAVRRLDFEKFPNWYKIAKEDLRFASSFRHSNLLSHYCSFVTGTELWVVMRPCNYGSAWRLMQYSDGKGIDESIIAYIMFETLQGIVYLHSQRIMHGGIKAASIMIDTDGSVQIADFKNTQSLEAGGCRAYAVHEYNGNAYNIPWLAPEVLDQDLFGYDEKSDMYSFGITMLELLHNHPPYSSLPPTKTFLMKMADSITLPIEDYMGSPHKQISKYFRQVVLTCLQRDSVLRPSAAKLSDHVFWKPNRRKPEALLNFGARVPPLNEHLPSRAQYLVHEIISKSDTEGDTVMGRDERVDPFQKNPYVPTLPAIECPEWDFDEMIEDGIAVNLVKKSTVER